MKQTTRRSGRRRRGRWSWGGEGRAEGDGGFVASRTRGRAPGEGWRGHPRRSHDAIPYATSHHVCLGSPDIWGPEEPRTPLRQHALPPSPPSIHPRPLALRALAWLSPDAQVSNSRLKRSLPTPGTCVSGSALPAVDRETPAHLPTHLRRPRSPHPSARCPPRTSPRPSASRAKTAPPSGAPTLTQTPTPPPAGPTPPTSRPPPGAPPPSRPPSPAPPSAHTPPRPRARRPPSSRPRRTPARRRASRAAHTPTPARASGTARAARGSGSSASSPSPRSSSSSCSPSGSSPSSRTGTGAARAGRVEAVGVAACRAAAAGWMARRRAGMGARW